MALPTHVDPFPLPPAFPVRRWEDKLVESIGHPIVSELQAVLDAQRGPDDYFETFWLPTLGPTAAWLARRLACAAQFATTSPTIVPLELLAREIGIAPKLGKNDPLSKAFTRLRVFGVARYVESEDLIEARTHLGPLPEAQIQRLPRHLATLARLEPAR